MGKKVAFKTLGCRLNQLETDSIVTDFCNAGYQIVPFNCKADVYVINTCTITNQSDQKSKNIINQSVRHKNSNGAVIVTGCMVTSQQQYFDKRDDITFTVDNGRKHAILPLAESFLNGETIQPADFKNDIFKLSAVEHGFHTRSAIKIQDGCNNHCTFCIVPKVRGRAKSRDWSDIELNITNVLQHGYKEIVLTGVNISRYHHNNLHFEDIVEKILNIPGDFRVRISSMEPEGFTNKFIELFRHPKLCPHLHLCLQSGSPSVLTRMRRFYQLEDYIHLIEKFRNVTPDFNFTTDIIVGFPGETDKEFMESYNVIKQIGFSHIHTFKYSVRKGTIAEKLPNHIPDKVKVERSKHIRQLSDINKIKYYKSLIGKTQKLLVENRKNAGSNVHGYGEQYVPIMLNNSSQKPNAFVDVCLKDVVFEQNTCLLAEIVS